MKISGHQIEWSYESIAAWPYAYWAHTHGLLTETESGPDSSCVYWYSPKHTIRTDERSWDNMKLAGDLPNLWIHKPRLDKSKWTLWKAGRMGTDKTIPNADYFGKIEAGHISGIAFAFHHKHKHMAQWEPWRRGDYRVIKRLSEYMKCHFVDDVFTIIGHAPPEKGTKEYINKKAQDHKAKIDMINAQVAEKLAARKAATMQGVPTAPTPHSCPTCGQPIPEKAP